MNINDLSTLDDQVLEAMRLETAQKIESLPGQFDVCGSTFSWDERHDYLSISEAREQFYFRITKDGELLSYSFQSTSGNSIEDAAKTIRYHKTCIKLLSDSFRKMVIADYACKKPEKDALEEAYWQVTDEQERRQKVQMEAAIVETEARKKVYKQLGSVWYAFSGASTRHTVSAVTEKTIAFKGWHFIDGRWETCPSFDMRVKKELLGFSPKTAKTTGKKMP